MLPETVHPLELLSALFAGPGALFLFWTVGEAWADLQEVPEGNQPRWRLGMFVLLSTIAKCVVMGVFCFLSIRAMTLPPATTNLQGDADVGAILVLVAFLAGELAMTVAAGYGVWIRQYIKNLPENRGG